MITSSMIILRDKKVEDAWDDYAWETDPELARLDAAPVLMMPYSQYLSDYTEEILHPWRNNRQFAIETPDGRHIGNCSYYNIDKYRGEAELGIMIGNRDYWDKGYGVEVITALVDHIFNWTNLDRIHLKTLDWNERAQKCFKKSGFIPCGQMERSGYKFVLMEVHRRQWEGQRI